MIDTLYPDAPENATQEQVDESLTLHEAKKRGYWPGETPGTAEEYLAHWRKVQEIDAKWKARIADAETRGTLATEFVLLNRQHAAEIQEQDDLWLHDGERIMSGFFDWDWLETRCEYQVASNSTPSREDDCGEPAVAKAWWEVPGSTDQEMLLCARHLAVVQQREYACTEPDNETVIKERES